jgi:hypothetical protein
MAETDWREELDGWLGPFLAALNHEKRRHWAPVYLQGLLGPGERKSLQPMAARLGQKGHDQLHHFIASPAWSDAPLRRLLVAKADALVGGPAAVLVVDDTALPKQGRARSRPAWRASTAAGSARRPTARSSSPSPWPGARSRCRSARACSCRTSGWPTRTAAPGRGCRTSTEGPRRRPTSRSPRSTGSSPPAPGSGPCWPTPATARVPPSAGA